MDTASAPSTLRSSIRRGIACLVLAAAALTATAAPASAESRELAVEPTEQAMTPYIPGWIGDYVACITMYPGPGERTLGCVQNLASMKN